MQASAFVRLIVYVFLTAFSLNLNAQDQKIKYRKSDYPDSKFIKTEQHYSHGDCRIRIIQVKAIDDDAFSPFTCRGWVEIERSNQIIHEIYLSEMDPVGAQYGLFIPRHRPNAAFFAIVKIGDYDGKLYLIDTVGNIREYWGGQYLITRDTRYLISEYHSDLNGIEIIDLKTGTSLFRSMESDPEPSQWYYSESGKDTMYYYVCENIPDSIYVCDFTAKKIRAKVIKPQYISTAHKFEYNFTLPDNNDCGCVEYSKPEKNFNFSRCNIRLTELGRRSSFQCAIRYFVACTDTGGIQIRRLFPPGDYEKLIELNSLEACMRSWHYPRNNGYWVSFYIGTNYESYVSIYSRDGEGYRTKLW